MCLSTAKLKSTNFFRVHVHMAIPYHTAKFKSTNSVKNVIWGKTAKFNDRQYFRLYGTCKLYHSAGGIQGCTGGCSTILTFGGQQYDAS